ncbi:MAG: hypothetical protein U5K79_17620 [Cyclobacteriaceae bacterium]|nr:hypothetical protein [Cyclobacteriaceae bacterium]
MKTQENAVTYDAFTDPEMRYRQRYVDLIVNPQWKGNISQAHFFGGFHAKGF